MNRRSIIDLELSSKLISIPNDLPKHELLAPQILHIQWGILRNSYSIQLGLCAFISWPLSHWPTVNTINFGQSTEENWQQTMDFSLWRQKRIRMRPNGQLIRCNMGHCVLCNQNLFPFVLFCACNAHSSLNVTQTHRRCRTLWTKSFLKYFRNVFGARTRGCRTINN